MFNKFKLFFLVVCVISAVMITGCVTTTNLIQQREDVRTERTTASYMSEGRGWGKKLLDGNVKPGKLDESLVNTLIGNQDFVNVIQAFEDGWGKTLDDAVRVFIVLVAEGSQADREFFINKFDTIYTGKYQKTEKLKSGGGYVTLLSEGGTKLYLDIKTTSAFLDIPSPKSLKGEIYRQAFRAMGDEWGKRLSTNLIKRGDLVDLLRRTKVALKEEGQFNENLDIIYNNFLTSYGTDAEEVFASLLKEAGYNEKLEQVNNPKSKKAK